MRYNQSMTKTCLQLKMAQMDSLIFEVRLKLREQNTNKLIAILSTNKTYIKFEQKIYCAMLTGTIYVQFIYPSYLLT